MLVFILKLCKKVNSRSVRNSSKKVYVSVNKETIRILSTGIHLHDSFLLHFSSLTTFFLSLQLHAQPAQFFCLPFSPPWPFIHSLHFNTWPPPSHLLQDSLPPPYLPLLFLLSLLTWQSPFKIDHLLRLIEIVPHLDQHIHIFSHQFLTVEKEV